MKGRIILGAIIGMTMCQAAHAGTNIRRDVCPRADRQQTQESQRQPQAGTQQQDRARNGECRIPRQIPAVVDPTPVFLL